MTKSLGAWGAAMLRTYKGFAQGAVIPKVQ